MADHLAIDLDDAPPPFSQYEAEFFLSSDGDIISHDHHLNEDGEALYRFLLAQSQEPPLYLVDILGTHTEYRTRIIVNTVNGVRQEHIEQYSITVTDFHFSIDLVPYIIHGPVHWSSPDSDPTYRGLMLRQITATTGAPNHSDEQHLAKNPASSSPKTITRKATKDEINVFKSDEYARLTAGVPPWENPDGSPRAAPQASRRSLREWADNYATSPKLLKEFVYEKVIYGWNTAKLEQAIESAIASTSYSGRVSVDFTISGAKICIRPDNRLSRTLSSTFYKVLLIIFLVYPFIWLFKRFSSRGGGRWEVYGGAYALRLLEPVGTDEEDLNLIAAFDGGNAGLPPLREPRIVQTEHGLRKLTGYREGEWFREWESTIKRCAAMRLRQEEPLKRTVDGPGMLEGYDNHALDGY